MTPEEFDKQFQEWLDKDVGRPSRNFDEWRTKLKDLVEQAKNKNYDEVLKEGDGSASACIPTTSTPRTPTNSSPRPTWQKATSRPPPRS